MGGYLDGRRVEGDYYTVLIRFVLFGTDRHGATEHTLPTDTGGGRP